MNDHSLIKIWTNCVAWQHFALEYHVTYACVFIETADKHKQNDKHIARYANFMKKKKKKMTHPIQNKWNWISDPIFDETSGFACADSQRWCPMDPVVLCCPSSFAWYFWMTSSLSFAASGRGGTHERARKTLSVGWSRSAKWFADDAAVWYLL